MGNNLPDQLLVESILRGNANAFGQVIKNTEALVAQIVFKMISNNEDRKDISQDIYLKAFNKLRDFKFQSKLSTWIAQIAYNTCLSYLERKKLVLAGSLSQANDWDDENQVRSRGSVSKENVDAAIFIQRKELASIMHSAIDMLTPIHKTLITLYHHEELSYEEIGQITELPEGTLKSYLFRARKSLRENILAIYKREDL
ncbi:MAG: RNA polymerase sigma factor [Bacteroidetes bacterium]|nr:RNA polymerase sigma factor [Bacteroidota bacterium]